MTTATKEKPKRRERTPAEKEAAKQRRVWLKAMTKQVEAMAEESPEIETIDGHALSPVNSGLAIRQCPHVSTVGGFRQWKKHGRQVKKGEKGIAIWFPSRTKQEDGDDAGEGEGEGGSDRTFFRVGTVFDVSQTEDATGKPSSRRKSEPATKREETPVESGPSDEEILAALTF